MDTPKANRRPAASRKRDRTRRTDRVWQDAPVVRRYLEGVRGAVPLADEQIGLILRIVRKVRPNARRLLDLGCGDGVLGRALQGEFPRASCAYVDFSEQMLAAARAKVPPRRSEVVQQDYGAPGWTRALPMPARFDVVVSGFSIHHQPDARKRRVYREILELLEPGGLFLNLEHVASRASWGEALQDERFLQGLAEFQGVGDDRRARARLVREYHRRADKAANILAPVERQCEWLRRMGYVDVDCFFKLLELALFGGCRPPSCTSR